MNNLAIIPARGGSKRIPQKNIRDFLGKPIIAYSIETAIRSGLFSEVMVSTDDEKIASIAEKFGAKIPFLRSQENANDFAGLAEVVDEVLLEYKKRNIIHQYVCCILPTAPLLAETNLKLGLEKIQSGDYYSVRPIVPFTYPIQKAFKYNEGHIEILQPKFAKIRSQDLTPTYHDAGQFYWFYFNKGLIPEKRGAIIISNKDAQDIDNYDDWKIAELKYKLNH